MSLKDNGVVTVTVPDVPPKYASSRNPAVPLAHARVPLVPVQKSDVVFHDPSPPVPAEAPLGSHVSTWAVAGVVVTAIAVKATTSDATSENANRHRCRVAWGSMIERRSLEKMVIDESRPVGHKQTSRSP
jgi:hypothetical protein